VTMWDSYLKNKNTKKKQFLASANMWGGTGTFKKIRISRKNNSWPVWICEVGQVLLKIRIPRKYSWPIWMCGTDSFRNKE
jgi:hypothetical protein